MSKKPKIKEAPVKTIKINVSADAYYSEHPSWCFNSCDKEKWEMTANGLWSEIIPKLKSFEMQTWSEILVAANEQNHSISIENINKAAYNRLFDLQIECDSLISLRLSGTHRLYGYMQNSAFCILWYDTNHGDNTDCVCRSHKKHT